MDANGAVWDLTSFFPEFEGPDMQTFKSEVRSGIEKLAGETAAIGPLHAGTIEAWEKASLSYESVSTRLSHLSAYVGCLEAAHTKDEAYATARAEIIELYSALEKVEVEMRLSFKETPESLFADFIRRENLREIRYFLERTREYARRSMSREKEILASDLNVDGYHAWGRLYDSISGKLEFEMTYPDGRSGREPISRWRSLMSHPDRRIGRAAFEGGNRAWKGVEDVCAAALNAIAGFRLSLYKHRGLADFLEVPLFQAGVRRETLEAMYEAVHRHLEIPRKIFRVKARFFGRPGIWFFEREAPLSRKGSAYTWEEGVQMVLNAYRAAYPALSSYFGDFVRKRWVESEARPEKRPGAFCTGSRLTGEQRVYMTFNGTLGDISTLAHEIGHAWHGHLLKGMRPLAQRYPMTLAETASIFAELIFAEGVFREDAVPAPEKLSMLDADLCSAAVMLLDITTRFEFEKSFFEERKKGEVPVSRLKELMVETQRRVFGDALLEDGIDPYFWASKLHFYITSVSFYNFPYTFGFLLALRLADLFRKEGEAFLPKYENLLKLAGSDTVEKVAGRSLGLDIGTPEFWAESIKSLEEPLRRYREGVAP